MLDLRPLALAIAISLTGCAHTTSSAQPTTCSPLPTSTSPLELVVLGSGGPRSTGRAASAYLVRVNGAPRLLIDVGPGTFLRLGELDVDLDRLDTVLLTHLHIDHAGDVPAFVKSRDLSYRKPLDFTFFGPAGAGEYPATSEFVGALFGTSGAFRYLPGFRNTLNLKATDVAATAEPKVLFEDQGLRVSAVSVDHGDVPALAFRVDFEGHSLVVTGDLASRTDAVAGLARGADVLVYDAAVLDPPAAPPILYELHTSPQRIGVVAAAAGVSTLLLGHLTPSVTDHPDQVTASIRTHFTGRLLFGSDCQRIDVASPPTL